MKKIFFYIAGLFLIISSSILNASTSSIYGRVVDKTTGKPIPNANIYLANTTVGTTTNTNGYFEIKNVPQGTFDIIFSHVAYYFHKEKVQFKHNYIDIGTIGLITKAYQLPTVVVEEEESIWKDQYEKFINEFIGEGNNADSTYIVDPYNIDFWEKDEKLFAACSDPIEIVNKALGYKIQYFLDFFESTSDYAKFAGNSVFTPLLANTKTDSIKWLENRDKTYIGSFRHFLKTLNDGYTKLIDKRKKEDDSLSQKIGTDVMDSLLNANGFFIYQVGKLPWETPFPFSEIPIKAKKILRPGEIKTERLLKFSDYLKVYFIPDYEEGKYPLNYRIKDILNVQSSYLALEQDSVMIDIYGRYYDKFGIHTYGKFGQERLSDLLPYEYRYIKK